MYLSTLTILALLSIANAKFLPRIANGQDVRDGEFPYVVSLQNRNAPGFSICGGSIINPFYVITTASCVANSKPEQIMVVAGTVNREQMTSVYYVNAIIPHEQFQRKACEHYDIALVKVNRPFARNRLIQFVPLPSPSDVVNAGDPATFSAWGGTYDGSPEPVNLLRANMVIVDQEKCKTYYTGNCIHESHICAVDPLKKQGICGGDTGSGLIVNRILVGLTAFRLVSTGGCSGTNDLPSVYTRVSYHLPWINSHAV